MKKYKLIKEYPGSPKLGVEVERRFETGEGYSWSGGGFYYGGLTDEHVYNHPEFWEKIVEKAYEILSFTSLNKIFNKKSDSIFRSNEHVIHHSLRDGVYNGRTEEYLLRNSGLYKIHSVKRLSDEEVFTIGDNVSLSSGNLTHLGKIDRIWISHDQLRIDIGNMGHVLCKDGEIRQDIIKTKQKLFTTEDGVDIFKNDLYYYFNNKSFELQKMSNPDYTGDLYTRQGFKGFSTKEKAEEYIIMNKPCLSVNDVIAPEINGGFIKSRHYLYYRLKLLATKKVGL